MRYLMLAVTSATVLAAAALGHYGPAALGETGWLASALGWILALGAAVATLAAPRRSNGHSRGDGRPA
ncbi:MAG: hypothetical protein MUF66_02865 [Gammaproteobacteria bacterium]|jgi:hypothetical protein|nr:hypothetical protein [Gammaproteobacteria bacterium]